VFLILTILSLITVIHLINRSGLVVLILCFVAVTIYNMKRDFGRVLGLLAIGAIVIYFVYNLSLVDEEILQVYEAREVRGHSISEGGGRMTRWTDAIELLFEHPWGYSDLRGIKVHHAHNLWLDVGRVAGVLPFVALLIVTISYGINFLNLLGRNDGFLCSIFLAYNVVFFLSCMVEPIMEGMALYFYLYVMFWGMQRQYLKIRENVDKLSLRNNI
jgi:O-antigen ligase